MSSLKPLRRWAFALHSWLGLISGVFLLLLGLSGSALVFREEIDHALNPALLRVRPTAKKLPLDILYRKIAQTHPNLAGIGLLNPDATANEAYEFRLYQNDGKLSTYDLGIISINPYSGQVLREGNLKEMNSGVMNWLFQFHWSFQLGIPGLLLDTLFGLTMLLSIVTGFVIYRKMVWKVLTFRIGINRKNWRTIASGLHRVVGVWSLVFNVVIFFTGFWMNKFSMDAGYWQKQTVAAPANTLASASIDHMLATAQKAMPGLIIQNIYLPTQPGKNFKISGRLQGESAFFHNGNTIAVSPVTGQIVSVERIAEKGIWDKVEAAFFPLHTGSYGSVPVKILYLIIGLLPGLLSVTGALLWWRRRRKYSSR